MSASSPSEAAPPAVLETTFVCSQGRPHLITQGCSCTPRSSR